MTMQQRYLYAIIFGVPGALISIITAVVAGGVVGGFFWIFVFGDDPWPPWTEWAIILVTATVLITTLYLIVKKGFSIGKKRELENIPVNKMHVFVAVILSTLIIVFIILHQRGWVLERPDYMVCQTLCIQNGYDGSGTSLTPIDTGDRICSCFNETTKNWEEIGPLE